MTREEVAAAFRAAKKSLEFARSEDQTPRLQVYHLSEVLGHMLSALAPPDAETEEGDGIEWPGDHIGGDGYDWQCDCAECKWWRRFGMPEANSEVNAEDAPISRPAKLIWKRLKKAEADLSSVRRQLEEVTAERDRLAFAVSRAANIIKNDCHSAEHGNTCKVCKALAILLNAAPSPAARSDA